MAESLFIFLEKQDISAEVKELIYQTAIGNKDYNLLSDLTIPYREILIVGLRNV